MNDLEQAIAYHERKVKALKSAMPCDGCPIDECSEEHRQLAEWLKRLLAYEFFADWLVEAVLEEDWEDDSDFYTEVLCRKLTKLGKLKVVDNKYMVVNADEKDN